MNKGINMATNEQIKQLEEDLRVAQEEEALLNLQSNGQEGTWAVEEARARLNKAINMATNKIPDCDRDGSTGDATITIKIIGNGNTRTYNICGNCYEAFKVWIGE